MRFLYEMFRRTRPGVPLLALYGKQKQQKRVAIFKDFSKKDAAVLFATDIAARGLDIPAVDWVIQFDCPDTVETYIHRVVRAYIMHSGACRCPRHQLTPLLPLHTTLTQGRTARLNKDGKALLFLLPSETAMVDLLLQKPVPIIKTEVSVLVFFLVLRTMLSVRFPPIPFDPPLHSPIHQHIDNGDWLQRLALLQANTDKLKSITGMLRSLCAEDPALKYVYLPVSELLPIC